MKNAPTTDAEPWGRLTDTVDQIDFSLHLERMLSQNITSCNVKEITGSMEGRPRSAYNSRPLVDEAQVELAL